MGRSVLVIRMPHWSLARHFLQKGIPVDVRDEYGRTPLCLAIRHERVDLVRLFVEHGADVNAPTNDEDRPLMIASRNGFCEIAKYLIVHGADVGLRDRNGRTALHEGAHYPGIIRALVEAGADVNAKDKKGRTPLSVVESTRAKPGTPESRKLAARLLRELGAQDQ